MAITIAGAPDYALSAIRLHVTGAGSANVTILRSLVADPSAGSVVVWDRKPVPATGEIVDWLPPFNEQVRYTIAGAAPVDVTLKWGTGVTTPAFTTTSGQWPLLRAPLDTSLGMFRLPIMSYAADFGLRAITHHIIGSPYPIVSSDVTELKSGRMTWATGDQATRKAMLEMVDTVGHILHLRAPCIAGAADDLFFVVTSLSESAPNSANPQYREWSVSFQQVPAPDQESWVVPPIDDRLTWGDVAASGDTWGDVLTKYQIWYGLTIGHKNQPTVRSARAPYVGSI